MNSFRAILLLVPALVCGFARLGAAAGPSFVYETPGEFTAAGDFNGDGTNDILVLDKATGNARVGYSGAGGSLAWSSPLPTGVQNLSGCAVGRFQQTAYDTVAVTAPAFNSVNLVDLSPPTAAGAPVAVTPLGIGPHMVLPLANAAGGVPPPFNSLLIASSENSSNAEYLDLLSLNAGAGAAAGEFQESGPYDRGNALQLSGTPATFAVGLVRGATNDTLDVWQFTNSPALMLSITNLVSGGDYAFGIFNQQTLPWFIFYRPGGTNLTLVPLTNASGSLAFGPAQICSVAEPIVGVYYLDLTGHGNGEALILFSDGMEGMSLTGGVPAFSPRYTAGAANGDSFTGIAPLGAGQFVLLDGPPGSLASVHAQVIRFDGTAFTQLSSGFLPSTTTKNTRANVWLFQSEPFVNRSAGLIAATNALDWTVIVTNLPGAIAVTNEADNGPSAGLGSPATVNLGAAPNGSVFGLANQYSPAISLFSYGGTQGAQPVSVTISPPPGSYTGPIGITFKTLNPTDRVKYRVLGSGNWQTYAASFFLTNDGTVEYYGTNAAQPLRSQLQFAAYALNNNNQLAQQAATQASPAVVSNSYQLPPALYNSGSGTLFYGRRSANNAGTVWAIHMDGSDDTYITNGVRPRASHDGRWLAFMREGQPFNNQGNIWVRNLLTGVEQRLLVNPGKIVCYDWEPDDSGLVLDYGGAIYKLSLNGSLALLVQSDGSAEAPVLNPTNTGLAYFDLRANDESRDPGVFNDPFAGLAPPWAPAWQIVTTVRGASWPEWSPDGKTLCFVDNNSLQSVDDGTNLWLVAADGATLNRVCDFTGTDNRFPHGALWTLDGGALVGAATMSESNGLWIIALNSDHTDCAGAAAVRLPTTPGDSIDFAGSVIPSTGFEVNPSGNIIATIHVPATVTNLANYVNSAPIGLTNLYTYSDRSFGDYNPYGLAVDQTHGYVYISDDASIFQYNSSSHGGLKRVEGVYPDTAALQYDGNGNPLGYLGYEGLAADQSGNLFFTIRQLDAVGELTAAELAGGVTNYVFPTDPNYNFELFEQVPNSIGVDGNGDLFEENHIGGSVIELPNAGATYGNPFSLPNRPVAMATMAVDLAGDVYAVGYLNNILYRYSPATAQWAGLVTLPGFNDSARSAPYIPNVLTVDNAGNVYFGQYLSGLASWNAATGGFQSWGNVQVDAIAADGQGDVFIVGGNYLSELQPALVNTEPFHVPVTGGTFSLPPIVNLRGGAGSIDLTGPFTPTCSNPQVTLAVGPFGVISFTCPPNNRTNATATEFTINVLGVSVPIVQAGNGYSLAAASVVELPDAGSDFVALFVSPNNGNWTAAAGYYNSDWITLNTTQGTGSGKVTFSFSANYGPTRTGFIVIANQTFTITQMGAGYASLAAPGTLIPSLVAPNGVAVDGAGNIYVADSGSKTIKEWIAATGNVVPVVSSGLVDPSGVAVDSSGNVYIADGAGGSIYELPAGSMLPAGSSELVTLVSGLGNAAGVAVDGAGDVFYTDSANNLVGKYNATAGAKILVAFGLHDPTGLAVDIYGNVFIADSGDHAVKKWAAGGGLSTVVASGLDEPTGVAVNIAGDLFIADSGANAIYELPLGGPLTYLAQDPNDIAVGDTGNLYFSDGGLGTVGELQTAFVNTQTRYETAAAGSDSLPQITPASVNLQGAFAPVSDSPWLTLTGVTNGVITFAYSANYGASRSAHISVLGKSIAVVQNPPSFALGFTNQVEGPSAGSDSVILAATPAAASWSAASAATWLHVAAGGTGSTNLMFHFDANPAATRTGILTIGGQTLTVTQAGSPYVATGRGGYVTNLVTGLDYPSGVAVDGSGNVYISSGNMPVIDEWTQTNGILTPIGLLDAYSAGVAVDSAGDVYYGANGAVIEQYPNGGYNFNYIDFGGSIAAVAVDTVGNVYVADSRNNLVEEWSAVSGAITTLVSSNLYEPYGLAVDADGNVYIADTGNSAIKEWSPLTQSVTTLVSSGVNSPNGVAVDGGGNVYIADSGDAAIKEWSPATGLLTTLVPNTAGLNFPRGVAVDHNGNVYVADYGNNQISELPRAFVDPSPRAESAAGGTDSLPVVLPPAENLSGVFAPASDAAWLAITSTNNGVVTFSFPPNTTADSPVAQLTLLGQVINITQTGPHSLSTSTRVEGPSAGNDSVILVVNPSYPNWMATANASWLHVSPGSQSGTGSTNIIFSYDPNYGPTQTGTITIGGVTLTVIQAGYGYQAASLVTNLVSTGLSNPEGVAVDHAGNVYIADTGDAAIKEWSPSGNTLTTLVSSGLAYPQGVAVDGSDNVYIADPGNNSVFSLSPTNSVLTFLVSGYLPSLGEYVQPTGVAVDGSGNVYFSDAYHDAVDEWTAANGNVTAVVSSGLAYPQGVAVDFADNVYIADTYHDAVEEYTPVNGQLTTLIPSTGAQGVAVDVAGNAYDATFSYDTVQEWSAANDSVSSLALSGLSSPQGVAVDNAGNIYIADTANNAIQEAPYAFVNTSTVYEGPSAGSDVLPAVLPTSANLSGPFTPTSDSSWLTINSAVNGLVSFSFTANNGEPRTANITVLGQTIQVNQNTPNDYVLGGLSTEGPAAGSDTIVLGVFPGTGTWTATNLYQAPWLHLSPASQSGAGSTNLLFSFDANPGATRSTYLLIAGDYYEVVQAGSAYVAANPVTTLVSAGLSAPSGVAVDGVGNVYFADTDNNAIKEWNPANNTVTTLVSTGLNHPTGVASDSAGTLFIADTGNAAVKSWSPATSNLTTLVSSGLVNPQGVALDVFGWLYISDSGNNAIYKVPYSGGSLGSPLVATGLSGPNGLAVDYAGNLYIASSSNNTIFKWTVATSNLTALVSTGLSLPAGVAVDPAGNVCIADRGHHVVKTWLAVSNVVVNLATSGLTGPAGVAVDHVGSIYITDTGGNAILERPQALVDTTPRLETGAAGSDALGPVLPAPLAPSLAAPFAPASDASWLTIGGNASGVVNFAFTANIGSSRTGHVTVLGQPVPVIQSGPRFSLGTTNRLESPSAGSDSVVLAVVPNLATWTATANAPWLHLSTTAESGIGSTNVIYSFDANPGATRSSTFTIAGQSLTITQAGSTYVAASLLTNIIVESSPTGVAVDGAGNVFVAFPGGIYKWTPTNNLVNYDFGYSAVTAVAVDPAGDIYWAAPNYGEVAEYSVSNNWSWVDYQNLAMPSGVAVDSSGNVYIADTGNAAIKVWSATSGNVATLIATGLASPTGVAVDAADNVYIADSGAGKIFKWTLATGQLTTLISSGLSTPNGLAVDASGNVYIADTGNNLIKEWSAASNTVSTLDAAGLSAPAGVAVDVTGNVYIADTGNNAIKELARAFVDPTSKPEAAAAASDSLPVVLPATENLNVPFAPASDQPWLTITSTNAGVVTFNFSAAAAPRTAHIAVLGQSISVVQTGAGAPFLVAQILNNGELQLTFNGSPNKTYTVLGTTNLAIPLSNWTVLGTATGNGSGSFQFSAPAVTNYPQQYFIITSQ